MRIRTGHGSGTLFALLAALVLTLPIGCGNASNTPEEAFESLRTALADERWDLLYDVLPPSLQQKYDEQTSQYDLKIEQMIVQMGEAQANESLRQDFGFDQAQWVGMTPRERFAAMLRKRAKLELRQLGVNPDYVVNSSIKNSSIRGDEATISLDDGKGHRTRLRFVLVDGSWRFGLGEG